MKIPAVVGLAFVALLALGPQLALGASDEAAGQHEEAVHATPEIHGKDLAFQLLNFGVLAFILIKFGGPAVSKALTARHQQLKSELAAAAEARAAAEAQLVQQERRLSALEQELTGIRAGIKQEAEAEKARLIELAEERARRIREETSFLIEQQVKEGEAELRREAARAAVEMAEQIVRRSLDAGDQQRLVDSFVDGVGDAGGARPRGSV